MKFKTFLPILLLLIPVVTPAQSLTPDADTAGVHVVVYSSYACPYCATWAASIESLIVKHEGRVSVQVRPFPLDATRERWAIAAAEALAAQGHFPRLHGSLFARVSGKLDADAWRSVAASSGVDLARFDRDIDVLMANPIDTGELARAHGVRVTPTTFVDGIRFDGLPSLESLDTVIRARLETIEAVSKQTAVDSTGKVAP